ncbi:hypothetical protein A4U49_09565 [Acidithiobacillus ferrivorans]|uniref:sigma factor-like helix-turn-helix DNA-binding protein n=1 Tax=Acidithiobacillus ferrivorans TaxID=160808 RepID=UPI000893A85C|nr:sigma factor-like helix-turn-helix DNA-binding protein [Acidithiobacillus ferrivorans]OFA16001.1 hypothetical protein A4U49_09565 [Acidithiobacillus ferrivorans]
MNQFSIRNEEIKTLFLECHTLEEIGRHTNLTRERVRQILLRKYGLRGMYGGQQKRIRGNARAKKLAEEKKATEKSQQKKLQIETRCCLLLGCSYEEARLINKNDFTALGYGHGYNGIIGKYAAIKYQRLHRGELWSLSLVEWHGVWIESGHWDNGPSKGWGMTRISMHDSWNINNVCIARYGSYWHRNKKGILIMEEKG